VPAGVIVTKSSGAEPGSNSAHRAQRRSGDECLSGADGGHGRPPRLASMRHRELAAETATTPTLLLKPERRASHRAEGPRHRARRRQSGFVSRQLFRVCRLSRTRGGRVFWL